MFGIVGIVVTFAMVFGGYMLAGGRMDVITISLPYEMMMIGGAALGAYLLSNDASTIKKTLAGIVRAFRGAKWREQDYQDVLALQFQLLRIARSNPIELEEHIENPMESAVFQPYPRILENAEVVAIICDTMRSASLNYDDPFQVEEILTRRINLIKEEELHVPHALQTTADALPALGIVAAVLGIIKTMSAIDQPPEILGKMIGGALVGTFLGVFLAYGFVAPLAQRLANVTKQDQAFLDVVKATLIAGLHQHATNLCVEVGRQAAPGHVRPSFTDLEDRLRELKRAA